MSKIYGFSDEYKALNVNPELILSSDMSKLMYSFSTSNRAAILYKLPENIKITTNRDGSSVDLKNVIDLNKIELHEKDSLYLHPDCTLPRASLKDKYKRVLKPEKANACVVPVVNTTCETDTYAIFVNEETKRIYVFPPKKIYSPNGVSNVYLTACENIPKGTKLKDINPSLVNFKLPRNYAQYYDKGMPDETAFVNSLIESKLVDYGPYMHINTNQTFIVDYLEGIIHDLVSEGKVTESLGNEDNQLNAELIDSIKALIVSEDPSVSGLGLKTLSEMDYPKYKNSITYLLNNTYSHWCGNHLKNSTSVKYMLHFLHLDNGPTSHYCADITDEDFELLQHVVVGMLNDQIKQIKEHTEQMFPFARITLDVSSSVTKK